VYTDWTTVFAYTVNPGPPPVYCSLVDISSTITITVLLSGSRNLSFTIRERAQKKSICREQQSVEQMAVENKKRNVAEQKLDKGTGLGIVRRELVR
jgi:hypothetical protein